LDGYDNKTLIYWAERNGVPATGSSQSTFDAWRAAAMARTDEVMARWSPRKVIVLTPVNRADEPSTGTGSDCYAAIVQYGKDLLTKYPGPTIDIRKELIVRGLSLAGLTPSSDDLTDISNDVCPRSLRFFNGTTYDVLHHSDTGKLVDAMIVQERLTLKQI